MSSTGEVVVIDPELGQFYMSGGSGQTMTLSCSIMVQHSHSLFLTVPVLCCPCDIKCLLRNVCHIVPAFPPHCLSLTRPVTTRLT